MNYTISRNGLNLGVYAEDDLREGVTSGRFFPHDLAWREGLPEWQALGQILGMTAGSTPPPLPPVSPFPPITPPVKNIGDDFGMRLLLPVGRSGWAIAAGYTGLFALAIVPAPLAVIISIIAIRDIQKSKLPGKTRKHGMGRAIFGLVTGIAGTLVLLSFLLG